MKEFNQKDINEKVSSFKSYTENELEQKLRGYKIPIIARIYKGNLILDVRTIFENEFYIIKEAIESLIGE